MTKTARATVGAAAVVAVLGWTSRAAATESSGPVAGEQSVSLADSRVRAVGPRVLAVLAEAAAQSKTFRGLVDRIGGTDGIVYVVEGECGHGVRACLVFTIVSAGPNRVLRILIDPRKTDREAMGSIGHELQHAVEVLSEPSVRTAGAIYFLFKQIGIDYGGRFETEAAILAGHAVRGELQKSATAAERRE